MQVSAKGQITIPADIRAKLGLLPYTEVEIVLTGKQVVIRKVKNSTARGRRIVEMLRGKGTVQMSKDVMALIRRD